MTTRRSSGLSLLSYSNAKIEKSLEYGYLTAVLQMEPHEISGVNLCTSASPGCSRICIYGAGRGKFPNVIAARARRTKLYLENRQAFYDLLMHEAGVVRAHALMDGLLPAIRPNGFTDIPAIGFRLARAFPDIQIYDYTKHASIFRKELPANYHVTFSRSEINEADCREAIARGFNVSVVFAGDLPETYWGLPVINGDEHDLTFVHPAPRIIGLSVKGDREAKTDTTGFVVRDYL